MPATSRGGVRVGVGHHFIFHTHQCGDAPIMKLTVELQKREHPEVALCFDAEGLELLIRKLEHLRARVDHLHLMTPAWAGQGLTEQTAGGEQYQLINSLRLVRLPDPPL